MNASASPARGLRAVGVGASLDELRYLVRHHRGDEFALSPIRPLRVLKSHESDTGIASAEKQVALVPG